MSNLHTVTERSPLLGRDHRQRQSEDSAATNGAIGVQNRAEATDNGSAQNNGIEADVERHEQQIEEDDTEILRITKSIKYILPVLGVGVRSLGSTQRGCRKADGHM